MKDGLYIHVKNEPRLGEFINHMSWFYYLYDNSSVILVLQMLEMNHFDLSKFSVMNYFTKTLKN